MDPNNIKKNNNVSERSGGKIHGTIDVPLKSVEWLRELLWHFPL